MTPQLRRGLITGVLLLLEFVALLFLASAVAPLQATESAPFLVKDINTVNLDADPENFASSETVLYFTADDGVNGIELWKSDGTTVGTVLVKDINPGSPSSGPAQLTVIDDVLYFMADDGVNDYELWTSDGTEAGTILVKDICPTSSGGPQGFTQSGGWVYFAATDCTNGWRLWKTDGTEAGTTMVVDPVAGDTPSVPTQLTDVNGTLFFSGHHPNHGFEVWKSDGTAAGTQLVRDINAGNWIGPQDFVRVGDALFFAANDGVHGYELWTSDGTYTGTVMVKDIYSGTSGFFEYGISTFESATLTDLNGTLIFQANDGQHGIELWRSDGTLTGTTLIRDIQNGTNHFYPYGPSQAPFPQWVVMSDTVFLQATDGTAGLELWKTDGTLTGTVMVDDIYAGSDGANPYSLQVANGQLYFKATDGVHGFELWRTDGTAAGTALAVDLYPGASGSNRSQPEPIAAVGAGLFLSTDAGSTGQELWFSDGTAVGTGLLRDINTDTPGSAEHPGFHAVMNVNDVLYLYADDGTVGGELWRSDGTLTGTVLVKDILAGLAESHPTEFIYFDGQLYFMADGDNNGHELWSSDGTLTGTVLVRDIYTGPLSSGSQETHAVIGDKLLMTLDDHVTGAELWVTDGTFTGTTLVKDINPGLGSANPTSVARLNDSLLFRAQGAQFGKYDLWRSDGTAEGTTLVREFAPAGQPDEFAAISNGLYYFVAYEAASGYELWKSDGSYTGTEILKDIFPGANQFGPNQWIDVDGTLFFDANDGVNGRELWKSDGTLTGTVMVSDIVTDGSSSPSNLIDVNGTLFFTTFGDTLGSELWKSDGTHLGTVLVKDIWPGTASSNPRRMLNVNGTLYFVADDGVHGAELWKSDGTELGTVLVADLYPGALGADPSDLTILNSGLYFRANDGVHGMELWGLPLDATGTADLSIEIADSQLAAAAGSAVTYTLVVSNSGPDAANQALVSDTFPAELSGLSWTCTPMSQAACPAAGTGHISVTVSLAPGSALTFTAAAQIGADAVGTLTNTASVSAPDGVVEIELANNTATDVTQLTQAADLQISKSDGLTGVLPGAALTYTVAVTNAGPSSLIGATISDLVPAELASVVWACHASHGAACGDLSGSGMLSTTLDLPAGSTVSFIVSGSVLGVSTETLTNTAIITAPVGVLDSNLANNTATDTTLILTEADVVITKTDHLSSVAPGQTLTYVIALTNTGQSAVAGVQVIDVLPAALTGAAWECRAAPGSSCASPAGTGSITTTLSLGPSGTAVFTTTATVSLTASGILTNTAALLLPGDVVDPVSSNNTATDITQLIPQADLQISKAASVDTVIPGNALTYTLVVTNAGPSNVTGATVIDTLSSGLTGIAWTCDTSGSASCQPAGSGHISQSVDLPAGQGVTFTVTALVGADLTGVLSNTAAVTAPGEVVELVPGNNSSTTLTLLTPQGDLRLSKTDGLLSALPGMTLTYTIIVTNSGPSLLSGAAFSDTFPASLTNITWQCQASGGSSCANPSGSGTISTTVDLTPGGTVTFSATAKVGSGTGGTLSNTAYVSHPDDINIANNQATDVTMIYVVYLPLLRR